MKKFLVIVFLSLLLNLNVLAESVSDYLKVGYKLHSVNLTSDNKALLYHLTLSVKKEEKTIKFKKEKNSIVVTCIVIAKTGVTVDCYKP